jgi:hypothetical protein
MATHLWQGTWQGKSPAGDQHRRSREVVRPTGGIVRGKFPSRKNGRMVHHEGLLELDAIYLFEASPQIVRYREQPVTIKYPDGARLRRYTPDFELVLTTGEVVLIEVKPMRSLKDEEVRHKLDCVAAHLKRSAQVFVILTDEIIRQEPYLSNLRWVYHQAPRVSPSAEAGRTAVRRHRNRFPLPISTAVTLFGECGVDPYSLLLAGHLRCELGQAISPDTQITLATEADHGWFWISHEYCF